MKNYRNSLLSIAASIAITSTAAFADYVPLTSTGLNDNQWTLFGVSGLSNDGTAASGSGIFTITDSTQNTITDSSSADELAVAGMPDTTELKNLALVDAITAAVEVRVDTTNVVYKETEPFRTIYIDTNGDDAPNFSFTYKASLEGKKLEYSVAGGDSYEVAAISYTNTFDNPIEGVKISGTTGTPGTSLNELRNDNTLSVVDYDFSNNPPLASAYETTHYNAAGANRLKVYSYDALNKIWKVFDSGNTAGTNDFNTLELSKAYWGKLDENGDGLSAAAAAEGGLVLGTPALTTANYQAAGLTNGWNLIAFDGVNPNIRSSSTGMKVTFANGGANDCEILDSTNNHVITIPSAAIAANDETVLATAINDAVAQAKLSGAIPYTFDLRAYPGDGAEEIIMLSNKRFTIRETIDGAIAGAITLTGANGLNPVDFSAGTVGVDTVGMMSVYGEYALIVEPVISGTSVTSMAASAASFKIAGSTTNALVTYTATPATLTNVATYIAAQHADFAATDIEEIDLAIDGTANHILIANAEPFTIQDHTFVRSFDWVAGVPATGTTVTTSINGTDYPTAALGVITNAATAATAIDTALGATGESISASVGTEVIIATNVDGGSEFYISESDEEDHLNPGTTTTDYGKGALEGVFSIDYLAKTTLSNSVTIELTDIPDSVNDTVAFDIETTFGTITGTDMSPHGTYYVDSILTQAGPIEADHVAVFDAYVLQINTDLAAAGLTATASHSYVSGDGGFAGTELITITGEDIIGITERVTNDAVGVGEQFTITFTAGQELGGDTTIAFDDLAAAAVVGANPAAIATAFKVAYDGAATGPNWSVADDTLGTLTFTRILAPLVEWDDADNEVADFTVAEVTGDTTSYVFTTTNTVQGSGVTVEGLSATIATDLGNIDTTALSADVASDLKFNSVISPDYVLDGPLYTMRDNNMTMKALITGTMNWTDSLVGWESIDLTRLPSEWLDSQDYTLFTVDPKAGYWAYLQLDTTDNPLELGTVTLSKNYIHYFNKAIAPADTVTTNHFSGTLDVEVTGLSEDDNRESVRVTAIVNSKRIELTRSGSTNSYTGTISTNEIDGIQVDTAYEVIIEVSDGLGNNLTQTYTNLFDNKKPTAPTVLMVNGELNISHSDVNVTGFYVFNATIPEVNTDSTSSYVAKLTEAGTVGVVCETLNDVEWDTDAGGLNVVALDGDGVLGSGNVSNAKSVAFMPILKNRILLTDTSNGDVVASTGGLDYNASCASQGANLVDTGVSLTAITDLKEAKLAYTSLGDVSEILATPATIYVKDTAGTVVKVTYPEAYAGDSFFISIDGVVFGYQAQTQAQIDVAVVGSSSANALDLDALDASNPKDDIEL